MFTPQVAAAGLAGGAGGAGGAKDRLADYSMDMADCPLDALRLSPADANCIGQARRRSRRVRAMATDAEAHWRTQRYVWYRSDGPAG
jgi:hypothetical protein